MNEIIFTKAQSCLKGEIYNKILEALKKGGWVDVATAPDTEFNIMKSAGAGTYGEDLFFQMRPFTSTNVDANNCITGTSWSFEMRLLLQYTPGEPGTPAAGENPEIPGTPGIMNRPNDTWNVIHIAHVNSLKPDQDDYLFSSYVDKSKACFIIQEPDVWSRSPYVIWVGVPTPTYRERYPYSRDYICRDMVLSSIYGGTKLVDYPVEFETKTSSTVALTTSINNGSFKNPQMDGQFIVSPFLIGSDIVGLIGELWGVLGIFNVPDFVLGSDAEISFEDVKYKVLVAPNAYRPTTWALPSTYLVARIAE